MRENFNISGQTVTAEMHALMYDYVYGYNGVFDCGEKLRASIISNNEIRIYDGLLISQGRFMQIVTDSYESIRIESGTSGKNRCDLIVAHFETNGVNEIYDIRVIKGVDENEPTPITGNTFGGDVVHEMPLYAVHIEGLRIVSIEQKFDMISSLNNASNSFNNPNLLINGDFQVWQRGESISIGTSKWYYTADRFRCKGTGTVSKVSNGLKVSGSTQIQYVVEDTTKLNGKKVTLSYSKNGIVTTSTFTVSSAILFDITLSANDVLNWAKVEVGTIATPFVPRLYVEELALCQRYYQSHKNVWCRRTSNALAKYYLPCVMRVEPTVIGTFEHFSMAATSWGTIASSDVMAQTNQIVIWASGTADWYVASEQIDCDAEIY